MSALNVLQLAGFAAGSVPIVLVSWPSLRSPRSHGFSRFFAWELILALFLLVADVWFLDPFAPHQLISWVLLVVCLLPLALGIRTLRAAGRPASERAGEPELLAFEKTTRLVSSGIYRYIRHPLYSSLLLLAWGIFFKAPGPAGLALAAASTGFLFGTAFADEAECRRFFGADYTDYMARTKRFLPFVV